MSPQVEVGMSEVGPSRRPEYLFVLSYQFIRLVRASESPLKPLHTLAKIK